MSHSNQLGKSHVSSCWCFSTARSWESSLHSGLWMPPNLFWREIGSRREILQSWQPGAASLSQAFPGFLKSVTGVQSFDKQRGGWRRQSVVSVVSKAPAWISCFFTILIHFSPVLFATTSGARKKDKMYHKMWINHHKAALCLLWLILLEVLSLWCRPPCEPEVTWQLASLACHLASLARAVPQRRPPKAVVHHLNAQNLTAKICKHLSSTIRYD